MFLVHGSPVHFHACVRRARATPNTRHGDRHVWTKLRVAALPSIFGPLNKGFALAHSRRSQSVPTLSPAWPTNLRKRSKARTFAAFTDGTNDVSDRREAELKARTDRLRRLRAVAKDNDNPATEKHAQQSLKQASEKPSRMRRCRCTENPRPCKMCRRHHCQT